MTQQEWDTLLKRHQPTFLAEQPAFASHFPTHEGVQYVSIHYMKAYSRWLRAKGYLAREDFRTMADFLRTIEHDLHNWRQREGR